MDADTPDTPEMPDAATAETPDSATAPGAEGAPVTQGPLDAELVRALEAIILVATEPVPS